MQTFLHYQTFEEIASTLDYRRLGKQRIEAKDIYGINQYKLHDRLLSWYTQHQIEYLLKRYRNHPAVLMWADYPLANLHYAIVMCKVWIDKGYNDNTIAVLYDELKHQQHNDYITPSWFGRSDIVSSHRANLLRKDKEFYSQYNWKEKPKEGYIWPVRGKQNE